MPDKLKFGTNVNPFEEFDRNPSPAGFDLSAFDAASGTTTVPPGVYVCRVERGELTQTKAGKPAYRLRLQTVEPSQHAGLCSGNGSSWQTPPA